MDPENIWDLWKKNNKVVDNMPAHVLKSHGIYYSREMYLRDKGKKPGKYAWLFDWIRENGR